MHLIIMQTFADSYATPADQRTDWQDYLLLRSRWWLYAKFVSTVFKSRRLIEENRYGNDNWAETSLDVMQAIESVGGRAVTIRVDRQRRGSAGHYRQPHERTRNLCAALPCHAD